MVALRWRSRRWLRPPRRHVHLITGRRRPAPQGWLAVPHFRHAWDL